MSAKGKVLAATCIVASLVGLAALGANAAVKIRSTPAICNWQGHAMDAACAGGPLSVLPAPAPAAVPAICNYQGHAMDAACAGGPLSILPSPDAGKAPTYNGQPVTAYPKPAPMDTYAQGLCASLVAAKPFVAWGC